MSSQGLARVVRGGLWLYLRSVVNNVSGFAYWMAVSAVGGAEVIGLTSATVALAGSVSAVLSLGVGAGLRRFVGFHAGRGDREGVARYFWTVLLFRLATFVPAGAAMALAGAAGLGGGVLLYAGVIVALGPAAAFDELLASHLETKPVFLGSLIGNAVKLLLGVGLVAAGMGWAGAVLGYVALTPAALAAKLRPSLRLAGSRPLFDARALRDVLRAGSAVWVPSVVAVLGQQLGVLTLFGVRGASEAGLYYVSFAITSAVAGLGASIMGLMMPVLSGMEDGRKRACRRAVRVSLALATPPALALAAYPEAPLGLLGEEYVAAAPALTLLAATVPASLLTAGVSGLLYAYGAYSPVLAVGMAGSLSRMAAYAPLSKLMGGTGTALSFALGACAGLAAAAAACRRVRFDPGFREAALAVAVPLCLALALRFLGVGWPVGAPLLLAASYACYPRLGLLSRADLRELAYALAPRRVVDEVYEHLRPLIDRVIG